MPSVFSKIISGDIPCYKVAEDDRFFAFLDIHPLTRGHTLVIPKKEVDKLFELDQDTYVGLMAFAKYIAAGMAATLECDRIAMSVIGLEVPHAHIHLIPINSMADIDFTRPKLSLDNDQMTDIATKIASHL